MSNIDQAPRNFNAFYRFGAALGLVGVVALAACAGEGNGDDGRELSPMPAATAVPTANRVPFFIINSSIYALTSCCA